MFYGQENQSNLITYNSFVVGCETEVITNRKVMTMGGKGDLRPVFCSSCKYSVQNQRGFILDFTKCEPCKNNVNYNIELVLEIGELQNNYEAVDLTTL